MQAIFATLDTLISAKPWKFCYILFTLALGIIYCIFNAIYILVLDGTGYNDEDYVYPILDWKNDAENATLFCLISLLVLSVIFTSFYVLTKIRDKIWKMTQKRDENEFQLSQINRI